MTVAQPSLDLPRVNPQKRNILIRRLARAPWWLLVMALLIILFYLSVRDLHPYPIFFDVVQEGLWTTIWVSIVAYALALVLGLIVALLRRSSNIFVYQAVTFYVEAVRGIPTLVLVYYMVLALIPEIIMQGNSLGEWLVHLTITVDLVGGQSFDLTFEGIGGALAGFAVRDFGNEYRVIIALAISYSAFLSEVFRAGIESVGQGQLEAAASLGMTRWQTMRLIVLPQAFRTVLPPLANDFIAMLKESSLVSVVGVQDITLRGKTYASSTFTFFQGYNVVALTYLILTVSLSMMVKLLEMYLDRGKERSSA